MHELDLALRTKQQIDDVVKEFGGSTDSIGDGYHIYQYGYRGRIGKIGIDFRPVNRCRVFILNVNEEELNRLRKYDNWELPSYESKSNVFDIELPVTCREDEFRRVVRYILDEKIKR